MDELIDKMAEAIWTERQPTASTSWKQLPDGCDSLRDVYRRMARAALGALKAARWEVVKLPELDSDEYDDTIVPVPLINERDGWLRIEPSREMHDGTTTLVRIASLGVPTPIGVADAPTYAVALLATARQAELADAQAQTPAESSAANAAEGVQ